MRHAFLVIAHNNFGVLQRIVTLLDHEGFDFFIHYDKKVKELPEIHAKNSKIYLCEPRVDVRWGDVSQIKCELTLLKFALECGVTYDYYHIISGTHLPLVGPDEFDSYFADRPAAVFQPMTTSEEEIDKKIRRWNLCTRTFKHSCVFIERSSQMIWRLSSAAQKIIGVRRFRGEQFKKASNWCSLSYKAAAHLHQKRGNILRNYRLSFCGDEFFAVSELAKSEFRISYRHDYLYLRFNGANPVVLNDQDLTSTKGFLWARKFEDNNSVL